MRLVSIFLKYDIICLLHEGGEVVCSHVMYQVCTWCVSIGSRGGQPPEYVSQVAQLITHIRSTAGEATAQSITPGPLA